MGLQHVIYSMHYVAEEALTSEGQSYVEVGGGP